MAKIDAVTKRWIRNIADQRAAEKGCFFCEQSGEYAVNWIQENCYLYQSPVAGHPFILLDWQYDIVMRMFGWLRIDPDRAKIDQRLGLPKPWGVVRRFNQMCAFLPKKNGKSPFASALALFLLAGDGEDGNLVGFAAKSGKQARETVGKNALAMVHYMGIKGSPLYPELKVNVHERSITHTPSLSELKVLASDDAAAKDSLHGLNGSCIVDEIHVVDEHLMSVLWQMGASRRNPWIIEISTAGKNPNSYGKQRFDHCLKVLSGEVEDQRLLPVVYAVPQDTTDEQLDADPMKYARMANPSLGQTIMESRFLEDYKAMRNDAGRWNDFKYERFNLWVNADSSWLDAERWKRLGSEFDVFDLPQYGGFDLGRTEDATALSLWCKQDDVYFLTTFVWITERIKRRESKNIPWDEWERQGFVTVVPGDVVTDSAITASLLGIQKQFPNIQMIGYDPAYASSLSATLESEHGIPMVTFAQRATLLTEPIDVFESLVIQGKVTHDGNACMDWMVGNARVKIHPSKLKQVVKPGHARSPQRIDAVDSAIMGLALCLQNECVVEEVNPYDLEQEDRVLWIQMGR